MMEQKISATNPQHQTYMVKNASARRTEEADIKMIVHVADAVENVH